MIDPLARWYEMTGNALALATAKRLSDAFLYESGMLDQTGKIVAMPTEDIPSGYEAGWNPGGHVESKIRPGAGVLRLGFLIKNDDYVKRCKGLFDYVESFSGGIGWHPKSLYFTGHSGSSGCETCSIRSMVLMATLLAENGYPEYWGNVTRAVRNHLVESQLQDTDWINPGTPLPDETPQTSYRNVPGRVLGAFAGWSDPNDWVGQRVAQPGTPEIMHCCASGAEAFYIAWHHIVTKDQLGAVRVNLLLNRDTHWVRVNSHLPHEGRVDLIVHDAPTLLIRIPSWVQHGDVRLAIGGSESPLSKKDWDGDYVRVAAVEPGEQVTVHFPMHEHSARVHIAGTDYTLGWRGDTVVDMSPRGTIHPLYMRDALKTSTAPPSKMVEYFVPDVEVPW